MAPRRQPLCDILFLDLGLYVSLAWDGPKNGGKNNRMVRLAAFVRRGARWRAGCFFAWQQGGGACRLDNILSAPQYVYIAELNAALACCACWRHSLHVTPAFAF
jgi:hypothetical protein